MGYSVGSYEFVYEIEPYDTSWFCTSTRHLHKSPWCMIRKPIQHIYKYIHFSFALIVA